MVKKILFLAFIAFASQTHSQENSVERLLASPNPFSNSTTISFVSTQEQGVFLTVKNVLGKTVFKKGYYAKKGRRKIEFERRNLNPGMYIYTIQSNSTIITKRFVIR